MKFKGLIMDISQHTVTVLTRNNEFYKLKENLLCINLRK